MGLAGVGTLLCLPLSLGTVVTQLLGLELSLVWLELSLVSLQFLEVAIWLLSWLVLVDSVDTTERGGYRNWGWMEVFD